MRELQSWLIRKKAALCILGGICAIAVFVIINSAERITERLGGSYVVRIRHHGVNAREMERSITIPLEDALFSISGIQVLQSSSENSLSSVFIRFRPDARGRYEAVRDAAQRVYETLPSSVQRPEILSSNNSRIPVWSAAVIADDINNAAVMLERIVKPRLESLEGTGEVLVSGAALKEILIILDQEKLSAIGLEPAMVASFLAMTDSIFSGGTVTQGAREIIVTVDGRVNSLGEALIPVGNGRFIELSDIAQIIEQEKESDTLSRLNGRETASIAVMGRDGADLRRLSSDIQRELDVLSLPLEFTILSDLGAEEAAAFRSVLNAAILGAIMVALISFLLNRKKNLNISGFFCSLAIPLICLISIAVLSFAGFSINRLLLAGIAAGVGAAIDFVILCSEKLRKCSDFKSASFSLSRLTGPLIAGGGTTVAALVPLAAIDDGGVRTIAIAIAVVTVTALVLSLTILPPLLLWELKNDKSGLKKEKPKIIVSVTRRLSRLSCRLLAATVRFCIRYPAAVLAAGLALTVCAVLLLFAKGVDTSGHGSEDSVFAQVEFEGGLLAEEVDRLLANYAERLLAMPGLRNVQTGSRVGSGSLFISFNPAQTNEASVRDFARQIYIPGGFVFFHEGAANERHWEIIISGDDDQKCRELAHSLALTLEGHPLIRDLVLNFKEGSRKMILKPDREILAGSATGFFNAANRARLGVFGPVSYKRMGLEGETDVRIRIGYNAARQSREGVLNLLVSGGSNSISSLQIGSLMYFSEEREPSSIRRDNRRRSASITITTRPIDPRRAKQELLPLFAQLDLPPGYSIEFDPQAIRQSEKLSATILSLVLAIIFCYMIIASINESFSVPLLVLSTIPPSLAIPAIILILSGGSYNLAVACAFIVVSGMAVNAAILCVDGIRLRLLAAKEKPALTIYLALREKMPVLLATTATTVAAAVPFLFLTEGANMLIRTLSLVGALGVAGSLIASVTIIPSLLSITNVSLEPFLNKYHLASADAIKTVRSDFVA